MKLPLSDLAFALLRPCAANPEMNNFTTHDRSDRLEHRLDKKGDKTDWATNRKGQRVNAQIKHRHGK